MALGSLAISFYNMSMPETTPAPDLPRNNFLRAILDFVPSPDQPNAVQFNKGAVFSVMEVSSNSNWQLAYSAKYHDGRPGWVLGSHVEECEETANWSRL